MNTCRRYSLLTRNILPLALGTFTLYCAAVQAKVNIVPLTNIEGDYQCHNEQRGYTRLLTINMTPTFTPFEDRFYIYQLLFTGDSRNVTGFSKGFMLYDAINNMAVDYVENIQDKNVKGPGLMYFNFDDKQNISFTTYFVEPGLNRVGSYHCKKAD